MSKSTFRALVHEIEGNVVFHNASNCPQAPVGLQLLVALQRWGKHGNGVAVKGLVFSSAISGKSATCRWFERLVAAIDADMDTPLAEGSVVNYTSGVTSAIMNISSKYVSWPSPAMRLATSARIASMSPFKHCVGFVDGSLMMLQYKPGLEEHADFYTRKKFYGINPMVVCDDQNYISHVYIGYPGSAHDQRVWDASEVISPLVPLGTP